jgi:hypothetical protein
VGLLGPEALGIADAALVQRAVVVHALDVRGALERLRRTEHAGLAKDGLDVGGHGTSSSYPP